MRLNKENPNKGYVPEAKSMKDPRTGKYVTINSTPALEETGELPEDALVIDMTSEDFLYQKLGSSASADDEITAAVSEEIKRLYELERKSRQQTRKPGRKKTAKPVTENVTDSVTSSRTVPATIEDGVVMYFNSFTSKQKDLINKAIVNRMPDIFIRQMFTMNYDDMKEFFDSYNK